MKLTITDKTLIKDVCDKMLLNGRAQKVLKEYLGYKYDTTRVEQIKTLLSRRSFREAPGVSEATVRHLCLVLGVRRAVFISDSKKSHSIREVVKALKGVGIPEDVSSQVCTSLVKLGFHFYRNDKTCR